MIYLKEIVLVHSALLIISTTVFGCYIYSAIIGEVPIYLPMISDCFVIAPCNYISRFGLMTGSYSILIHNLAFYDYLNTSNSYLCTIISLSLATLSCVNEKENSEIHSIAAYIFFVAYWVHMVYTSVLCYDRKELDTTKPICCGIMTVSLIHAMYSEMYYTFVALYEWICFMCIMVFTYSTRYQLKRIVFCDICKLEYRK